MLLLTLLGSARAEHPLAKRYLEGLFRAKPHLATFMGDHRFDGRLPDTSSKALKARTAELNKLLKDLLAKAPAGLDDQIDAAILGDAIRLELLYLNEIRDWEWDPRLLDSFPVYDPREIVAGRLSDILHGSFAPEAARRASVVAQCNAMPGFIKQRQQNLLTGQRRASAVYVEQAIKNHPGRIEFFEKEVVPFVQGVPKGKAACDKAIEALKGFQTFLEKELKPKADGDWRLGDALFRKKFPLALQTDKRPEDAILEAEATMRRVRGELFSLARKLHARFWPGAAVPVDNAPASEQAALIDKVKGKLSEDHPRPEDLVAAHARNLDEMRAFIEKHQLVALPPRESLEVQPMPAFKRGSMAAEYLAPGMLDRSPGWKATYYVDPIDPTWPPERVESYLRGQNDYDVQLTGTHEAYPGHHTQAFHARQNPNDLRSVLWNPPMVEGWAVYGEGQMVDLGWGGEKNDNFRFYDLRGLMIVSANLIIDVKLHTGQMTDADAVRFLVEETFQEQAMAERKLLRAKLDSTQLSQYFLGWKEIQELANAAREKAGEKFSQRVLNDALIGHGSIAVKYLKRYVLNEKP